SLAIDGGPWWGIADYYAVAKRAVADGTWHHVAGTYDGVEQRIYVDGEVQSRLPWWGEVGVNSNDLVIGNSVKPGSNPFDGQLSDIRIYNRALTAMEVTKLYNTKAR